jgi:hypothetical protein
MRIEADEHRCNRVGYNPSFRSCPSRSYAPQVCHNGFCQSECLSSGPRLHMGDRYYRRHEMHRPGKMLRLLGREDVQIPLGGTPPSRTEFWFNALRSRRDIVPTGMHPTS